MKRVLNGVHVLMAVGLIVALAACSGGSDSGLKQERDQALAAAEAAEAAKIVADAAAAQAAIDKKTAEDALAQAAADKKTAEDALAQAEADKMALEDQLAGVSPTIDELEATLVVASDALTAAAEAQATADTALADATAARMAAQATVDTSDAAGLADAIVALQAARADEEEAEVAAMAAAEIATAAEAEVATAQAAVGAADTGPASETLTAQARKKAIAGARRAFSLLDRIVHMGVVATPPALDTFTRKETTALKVSHNGEAAKFSATMTDSTNRTTTVFSQADVNMAPAIAGWSSATLTGKKDRNNATGLTYSNIDAPKDKLFAVQYGTDGADRALGIGAVANSEFARANIPATNTWVGGTAGGSIDGSYRGVEGTFTCSTGCPMSDEFPERRTDGTVVDTHVIGTAAIDGDWTFEPADENAMVKVQDSDYLSFGYWLSKDTAGGPVRFAVWYDGSAGVAAATDIDELDEKVVYTGAAAGKYVVQSDVPNTAHAGYFTADAALTATFSSTSGVDDTVTGTISGFMDETTPPLGDLKLTLTDSFPTPW